MFAYDGKMADYLKATGRADIAELADGIKEHLRAMQKFMKILKNIMTRFLK